MLFWKCVPRSRFCFLLNYIVNWWFFTLLKLNINFIGNVKTACQRFLLNLANDAGVRVDGRSGHWWKVGQCEAVEHQLEFDVAEGLIIHIRRNCFRFCFPELVQQVVTQLILQIKPWFCGLQWSCKLNVDFVFEISNHNTLYVLYRTSGLPGVPNSNIVAISLRSWRPVLIKLAWYYLTNITWQLELQFYTLKPLPCRPSIRHRPRSGHASLLSACTCRTLCLRMFWWTRTKWHLACNRAAAAGKTALGWMAAPCAFCRQSEPQLKRRRFCG